MRAQAMKKSKLFTRKKTKQNKKLWSFVFLVMKSLNWVLLP